MNSYKISDFSEFHDIIQKYNPFTTIYRGVTHLEYRLVPKVGRDKSLIENEQRLFYEFKRRAFPHISLFARDDDWVQLALAQHHGLPTRLLDWSRNPLVACYFAVNDEGDQDCVIYITNSEEIAKLDKTPDYLFANGEIFLYDPDHITPRIIAQSGVFTVHCDPLDEPLELKWNPGTKTQYRVDKIIIDGRYKKQFRNTLNIYGINKASLFPGLDGIASYLEWITKSNGGI